MNFKVRAKNPTFWIGLVAVILTAMGVKPEMFTSWAILWEQVVNLFSNPFLLGSAIIAIIGYFNDPTTYNGVLGLGDSMLSKGYDTPKKDKK